MLSQLSCSCESVKFPLVVSIMLFMIRDGGMAASSNLHAELAVHLLSIVLKRFFFFLAEYATECVRRDCADLSFGLLLFFPVARAFQ